MQSYQEAIDLSGTDTRAYLKLLDAYQEKRGSLEMRRVSSLSQDIIKIGEQLETEDREDESGVGI